MTLGIEDGYTIHGARFSTQADAMDALKSFSESGRFELHPDLLPRLTLQEEQEQPFKLSVVAREKSR